MHSVMDEFPGYGAHVEMELMARAGLSNADVLRIATVNGASLLGIDDEVGAVAPGKITNLLVLERNPLADIGNTRSIERVILKGRASSIRPERDESVAGGSLRPSCMSESPVGDAGPAKVRFTRPSTARCGRYAPET